MDNPAIDQQWTSTSGAPYTPTREDPLCGNCGEPKHTHFSGSGTSTVNMTCSGFKYPTATQQPTTAPTTAGAQING